MSNAIPKLPNDFLKGSAGAIVLLSFTAFCCTLPLFLYGTLLVSHDINFHVFQANEFCRALESGSLFPKWALNANKGYGSANFIFYSPVSYYFVALIHLYVPSIVHSIIAAVWSSFFLSGIAMFFTVRKMADHVTGALCAVLYQIFPVHIFNLYLRGSLAELFAYIWFPLMIYFLLHTGRSNNKLALYSGLSVSYAGLILTHLVSAYIFTAIVIAYLIYLLFTGGSPKRILSIPASLAAGLGLSSFFLLPVVFEKKFVQVEYVFEYIFSDFRNNFLFLVNNLYGTPGRFYIPVHIAVILELLLFMLIVSFRSGKNGKGAGNIQAGFFVLLFMFSFFMTTPLSGWLWKIIPTLRTIQFPWRWVSFMELSLLYLIVDFFMKKKWRNLISGGMKNRSVLYVLVTLALQSAITVFNADQKIPEKELQMVLYPERAGYDTNQPKEYTPVWATGLESLLKRPSPERVTVLSGKAAAEVVAWKPENRLMIVDVSTPAVLRVATFYFPGWVASLDGLRARIGIENETGEMLVSVPNGRHLLLLQFIDTPVRRFSKYISIISCIFIVAIAAMNRIREKRN